MHKLLSEQLAQAINETTGAINLERLVTLVDAAYNEYERDLIQTERSMSFMLDELGTTHRRVLDAIDAVPAAISLFDADDRLVLWNNSYADLSAEIGQELVVGMHFGDMLRKAVAAGHVPEAKGRAEEWIAKRLADRKQEAHSEIQQLRDGRYMQVDEHRTGEGGHISIRTDITNLILDKASFKLLFENNPVPMFVCDNETLEVIAVNQAAATHYGYAIDTFSTKSVYDLDLDLDCDSGSSVKSWEFAKSSSAGGVQRRHRRSDGSVMDVAVYFQRLVHEGRDATLFAVIDLTERKRAEREIRETREFLNTVIDHIPTSVIVKDAHDLRYVLINRAAEEFLGVPRGDVVGKYVHEFLPQQKADVIIARDRHLIDSGHEIVLDEMPLHDVTDRIRHIRSHRVVVNDVEGQPRYLLGIVEDTTERKAAELRIAHLANHDSLTDLPNRTSFNRHMADTLVDAALSGSEFGVICLDIDRFKSINDLFGHAVGDVFLKMVAERLKSVTGSQFLARLGGDEFIAVVAGGVQPATTEAIARHLQAVMADAFEIEGKSLKSGISVGAAIYPQDGRDIDTLLRNADAALYRAKADGRGSIRFFEIKMDEDLRERRALQHDLREAVERNELLLYFQPQAEIGMNTEIGMKVVGFESLLRWQHPTRGMVPPTVFIPIAEENGSILKLGEWVLREACREAASWPNPLMVSVNLSPAQFRHGNLPALVHTVLMETGLAAHRLVLEITEGVLIEDFEFALTILRQLKSYGVQIAIDDFGIGYSSLSYLHTFPLDKIKIDQSFVAGYARTPRSAAIIRAVIGLGKGLNLPVLAEGVETQAQLDFLVGEGCSEIQGYLLGRPQPIVYYTDLIGRGGTGPLLRRSA
jgi:diguanylate cyclase (GGDEF)-like protein/PAS domain S-box-containing protein